MPLLRRYSDTFMKRPRLPKDSEDRKPLTYKSSRLSSKRDVKEEVKATESQEIRRYLEPEDIKDRRPIFDIPDEPLDSVLEKPSKKKRCWPRKVEAGADKIWTMQEQLEAMPRDTEEFVTEDIHYTLVRELKEQIVATFTKNPVTGRKSSVPEGSSWLRGWCGLFGKKIRYKIFYLRFPVICPRCRHDIFRRKVTPESICCCFCFPFLGWVCAYSFLEYACDFCGECWEPDDVVLYCRDLMELEHKLSDKSIQEILPFAPQHFK